MIRVSIKGEQKALQELKKRMAKIGSQVNLTVGIHEGENRSDDTISNAQLGAMLNYGTEKIPARPWLVPGFKSGFQEYSEVIKDGLQDQLDPKIILDQVGLMAVGYVQEFVSDLKSPGNAESTISKKGFDNPLVETGNLRQSISYQLTKGKAT